MGYDLYGVVDGRYFRANIWGMGRLRNVMIDAKVDLAADSKSPGNLSIAAYYAESGGAKPSLGDCFCTNDGWVVTAEECKHIAEQLGKWLVKGELPLEDMLFVQSFTAYCRGCVDQEGFTVH